MDAQNEISIYNELTHVYFGKFIIHSNICRIFTDRNNEYLFAETGDHFIRFGLSCVKIKEQKATFLIGSVGDNSVSRFVYNQLYDWHLMSEIFSFLPKLDKSP